MRKIAQSEINEEHQIESEKFGDKPRQQTMKSLGENTFCIELTGKLGKRSFDTTARFENDTTNHGRVFFFRVTPFNGKQ